MAGVQVSGTGQRVQTSELEQLDAAWEAGGDGTCLYSRALQQHG